MRDILYDVVWCMSTNEEAPINFLIDPKDSNSFDQLMLIYNACEASTFVRTQQEFLYGGTWDWSLYGGTQDSPWFDGDFVPNNRRRQQKQYQHYYPWLFSMKL